jgi:hypothetical protein
VCSAPQAESPHPRFPPLQSIASAICLPSWVSVVFALATPKAGPEPLGPLQSPPKASHPHVSL